MPRRKPAPYPGWVSRNVRKLRTYQEQSGKSATAIAEELGVSFTWLCGILTGQVAYPSADRAFLLEKATRKKRGNRRLLAADWMRK